MNRSARPSRDRAASRRGMLSKLWSRRSPRDLAASAGRTATNAFEALEPRQLMFVITMDNSDPLFQQYGGTFDNASGLARVEFDFGVVNPYLGFTQQPNFGATAPDTVYGDLITSRVTLVHVVLTGPQGMSADFRDLYNNPMVNTIALGKGLNAGPARVDLNDDAIPDFNDGLGSVRITGANAKSSIMLIGGTIGVAQQLPADADVSEPAVFGTQPGFYYGKFQESVAGLFDTFESFGFGYSTTATTGAQLVVNGLPPGDGSVIMGSPWLRDRTSGATYRRDPIAPAINGNTAYTLPFQAHNFNRTNQGIFVVGSSFGSINIAGVVHGFSRVDGSIDRFSTGYMVGSLSVGGDLGSLVSASDAGVWVDEGNTIAPSNGPFKTGAQINVGRTLGQVQVEGRSLLDVFVTGDLSSPGARPTRDAYKYNELEYAQRSVLPQGNTTARNAIRRSIAESGLYYFATTPTSGLNFLGQSLLFGAQFLRNDAVLTSEFIGSASGAAEIFGSLGAADEVNRGEDPTDVYAFPADGSQDVVVRASANGLQLGGSFYARIVDADGRTLAAIGQYSNTTAGGQELRFRPAKAGVYYLVLQAAAAGANITDINPTNPLNPGYDILVTGLAPVTMGLYRTGLSLGHFGTGGSTTSGVTVSVLSGSLGEIRSGAGVTSGTGALTDPSPASNTILGLGSLANDTALADATISVTSGNLYSILAGGDIKGATGGLGTASMILNVGGNLGTVTTGVSSIQGVGGNGATRDVFQGDLRNVLWNIGGSIAMLDIRGAIGLDQDATNNPKPSDSIQSVIIRTGRDVTKRGDVGLIRVGSNMGADTFSLVTGANATVGGVLISQDFTDGDRGTNAGFEGIYGGGITQLGINLTFGINSDLRFFDTPRLDAQGFVGVQTILVPGQPFQFVDDGGAAFTLTIVPGPNGGGSGTAISIPRGQKGVAMGRITVDLSDGAQLQIVSQFAQGQTTPKPTDVISIGRILITNADANSSIVVDGPLQIDVNQILQTGGQAFGTITNNTPGGDLATVDVAALTSLTIATGDLGRTQMPSAGPRTIGPFVGITGGTGTGTGIFQPIGVPQGLVTGFWNGNLYRRLNDANTVSSSGDDVGMPVDPYLDGLRVRTGGIASVSVGGAVGDVIATGGTILQVIANANNLTEAGRFKGVVGNIFGARVGTVDVGDGLLGLDSSPLAHTSIVATDDIGTVTASRSGANISGYIEAANSTINANPADFPTDGINVVQITGGGSYRDAHIAAMALDDFWTSVWAGDSSTFLARVASVSTTGGTTGDGQGNLFRSSIRANTLGPVTIRGAYDATLINTRGSTDQIEAIEFRNSTLGGGDLEVSGNIVTSGEDVRLLQTTGGTGDISDLTVVAQGRVNLIQARDLQRSNINAVQQIVQITIGGSMNGSTITAGRLTNLTVAKRMTSSLIDVAGPVESVLVADSIINSTFQVSGPDGRISKIIAANDFSGRVISAGPIDTLEATAGDLRIDVTTSKNLRGANGGVNLFNAGRDLVLSGDVQGPVVELRAGRNVGDPKVRSTMVFRGDVTAINATNGMLYSDFRFARTLQTATFGGAVSKPGNAGAGTGALIAFGRIETITIGGDFAGQIVSYSGGLGVVTINNGSLLPTGLVAAYAGDLQNLFINAGNLYGTVHADWSILAIRLNASNDGVFGDIGVNPAFSQSTSYDATRNQLPPGVAPTSAIQGPSITAGRNIGRVILTNGSIFEAFIFAGRALGTVDVTGNISNDNLTTGVGTVIAAGSTINLVHATGNVSDAAILAGVVSFGADGRPGGTGNNADTMRSGRITTVQIDGNGTNVAVAAGMNAGADGLLNSGDETKELGISYIRSITVGGTISNVTAFADSPTLTFTPGVVRGGTTAPVNDPDLSDGTPAGVALVSGTPLNTTFGGDNLTILFTGPGTAFFDSGTGRVLLINTRLNSNLTVTARTTGGDTATLSNFKIVTNNNASVGLITVDANLAGDSRIVVDAYALGITVGDVSGTTQIRSGMNLRSFTAGAFTAGSFAGAFWVRDLSFQSLGASGTPAGNARIDLLASSTLSIFGSHAGLVSVERDLTSFGVGGAVQGGLLRVGSTLGSFTAGSITGGRVAAGDSIGSVTVFGSVSQANIQAGGDLGADAAPGGTLFNADSPRAGAIGNVTINGNFARSSLVAGILRGPDGFFGTTDDTVAPGLSSIGNITIAGTQVGSNVFSEQYRIQASNSIGTVLIGGAAPTNTGNFRVDVQPGEPSSIRVEDLSTKQVSGVWTAKIQFNQAINISTISAALSIAEVRNAGATLVPLVQGVDYFIGAYDPVLNAITINFATAVTNRNLIPVVGTSGPANPSPSLPGPGVFRFTLRGDVLRAAQSGARLDANGDGLSSEGENYVASRVVGDAGDREANEVALTGSTPPKSVDLYEPSDLDEVLRDPSLSTHVPQPNVVTTISGVIGDHPDHLGGEFSQAADLDIYSITLQAGQILRLGAIDGSFQSLNIFGHPLLYYKSADLEFQSGSTPRTMQLPTITGGDYLIKSTGTYFIVMGNFAPPAVSPSGVFDIPNDVGNTGDYSFTVQVFDDGNSGFNAGTTSGNAQGVPDAPAPGTFVLSGGVYQPQVIGDYTFTLNVGADGVRGTGDDVVTGTNSAGNIVSSSTGAGAARALKTVINSSIGPSGHSGAPGDVTPDVDVYALNNGQAIPAGKQITVKVKLRDKGGDLGSSFLLGTGGVQFAIFDVTNSTAVDDGLLLYAPTDFSAIPGKTRTIATGTNSSYGYDAEGNFFITFVTPGQLGGSTGSAAKYDLYLQGIFNSDYTIEYTQAASVVSAGPAARKQNIFIETRGGTIDWLEAGGLTTALAPYNTSILGFNGNIGGLSVDSYILSQVVATVQSIFSSAGLNVVVSSDPSAFEFQPFSTVFLTSTNDPTTSIGVSNFGYSQHSDSGNLDANDDAVVFLPSLALLGYSPSQAGADLLAQSISAAVTRRAGELMGLRLTASSSTTDTPIDVLSSNSVSNTPNATTYAILNSPRALSDPWDSIVDTDFFLGQQNAFSLLSKFLA